MNFDLILRRKTLQDRKTLPRIHIIGCRCAKLFLPKDRFKYCQNVRFWVLSGFQFLGFIRIKVFEFCCYLSFFLLLFELSQFEVSVLSQYEFHFCHNLSS